MQETSQSLSELWALLRNKEQQYGLGEFSLTERDVLQNIIHIQGKNIKVSLEDVLKACPHPRATFFRCLKKLRTYHILKVLKDHKDARKSSIKVSPKFIN